MPNLLSGGDFLNSELQSSTFDLHTTYNPCPFQPWSPCIINIGDSLLVSLGNSITSIILI